MAAILCWQIDAVGLVVGGEDQAENVEHVVLAQIFLVDSQHVGRGRGVNLGVVIKVEAIGLAQVARLIDAQDDRFDVAVEIAG